MGREITISPMTRLEGHGKIDILLNDDGSVKDAFLQIVELRGFEKFCEGRHVEELPRIMPKICGVCPSSHHMASSKAVDAVFKVDPPETAKKLRELYLAAHIVHSHILHFYALGAPDFLITSTEAAAKRNILGLIEKVGEDVGRQVIKNRGYAQKIQEMIAGHATQPVAGLPGGMSKSLTEEERQEIEDMAKSLVEFSRMGIKLFEENILKNKELVDLIAGDTYYHETNYLGLQDEKGKLNFYDGKVRGVNPKGKEICRFNAADYLDHIGEKVESWSYLKFPYLKDIGWKGLTDGEDSGIYRVNSLARLNASEGMATPLAQEEYERMFDFFGSKPVHNTLAFHWARLIETLYGAERVMELVKDPAITGEEIRNFPTAVPSEGVGCVEAPRGTLYHHYKTDPDGVVEKVNLIVATVQNNGAMSMSVKKAAEKLIQPGVEPDENILNMVEMAFRAYDPCLACATHALPGEMPLKVRLYKGGGFYKEFIRE